MQKQKQLPRWVAVFLSIRFIQTQPNNFMQEALVLAPQTKNETRIRVFYHIAIGLIAMFLAACNPVPAPENIEKPIATKTEFALTKPTATTLACENAKLIFPLPTDANKCMSMAGGAAFRTGKNAYEVIKFYRDFFENNGWTLITSNQSLEIAPIAAWSKGKTTVQAIALPQNNETGVSITVLISP